ncbi:unnamed protein product [Mesocestoides corti]|uniref:Uncharacterized protein n=4 Tax=Mesocestoides corti TaxID=53468 RepID=A0A158QVW0_MESCO|nr:unnamed protein product [Mesocestoides corti]
MFAYLSKKIAIPNNQVVSSIAWSMNHGYLACGGESGLLKVLKLDVNKCENTKGLTSQIDLSMNQTLKGHSSMFVTNGLNCLGTIQIITWNDSFEKLTTADEEGVIIVWALCKGLWYEEMINNRNKSRVKGLKWDREGRRICIAYEDGAVIVGSVDGNRIWHKELKCTELVCVEWAPHGRSLLLGLLSGEVHVYDSLGVFLNKLPIYCLNDVHGAVTLAGFAWYKGENYLLDSASPSLVVCFDIGRCQIMKNENDTSPVLLDTGLGINCCAWNEDGSILAIGGHQKYLCDSQPEANQHIGIMQFYSNFGDHLYSLALPGKEPTACAWEGAGSFRLAIAINSYVYFANLRLKYHWTYSPNAHSLIYAFTRSEAHNKIGMFWDIKRGITRLKPVENLMGIAGDGDYCCVTERATSTNPPYRITVYNTLGSVIDCKMTDVEPKFTVMVGTYVAIASNSLIFLWQFKNPRGLFGISSVSKIRSKPREGIQRMCHIDHKDGSLAFKPDCSPFNIDSLTSTSQTLSSYTNVDSFASLLRAKPSENPIVAMTANDARSLFVARSNGDVVRYRLPELWPEVCVHVTDKLIVRIEVNCDSSTLGVIDEHGILTLHSIPESQDNDSSLSQDYSKFSDFACREVWDLKFSSVRYHGPLICFDDDPKTFAVMEKTKLVFFHETEAEPAIQSSAYIASFSDLEVVGVLLDDVMQQFEHPKPESIVRIPTRTLNECRNLIEHGQLEKARTYIENHPHPRFWYDNATSGPLIILRIYAEAALHDLNLTDAEFGFVMCQYYQGIDFVKRLRNIQSEVVRMAEVRAYFNDFDGAEGLFLNADRCDLAIELRKRLGDWFRVAQLAKESGAVVRDRELTEVWNAIGDHYFNKQCWSQAADFYRQGGEYSKLIRCLFRLEDYDTLENLVTELPEGHCLLPELARIFSSISSATPAAAALALYHKIVKPPVIRLVSKYLSIKSRRIFGLLKCGKLKEAVDVCLELNDWSLAVQLTNVPSSPDGDSVEHDVTARAALKRRLVSRLRAAVFNFLDNSHPFDAVEILKRAGYYLDAARLLLRETRTAQSSGASLKNLKKMYVMIGILIEKHHEQPKSSPGMHDYACSVENSDHYDSLFSGEEDNSPQFNLGAMDEQVSLINERPRHQEKKSALDVCSEDTGTPKRTLVLPLNTYEVTRLIDQPWRGAEACHYLMLSQKQLYSEMYEQALRTAILLRDYDDIFEPRRIHSIIALCALKASAFATASQEFMKLQNISGWSTKERQKLEDMVFDIFSRHPPENQLKTSASIELDMMLESETKVPICAVTGQPVTDYQFWMCPVCKHSAYEAEISRMHNCPICHSPVQ